MAGGAAAARRAEARDGLWTRSRRRGRGREAGERAAAAWAPGSFDLGGDIACGGGRRGHPPERAMAAGSVRQWAGKDGGEASGITVDSAGGRWRHACEQSPPARSSTRSSS